MDNNGALISLYYVIILPGILIFVSLAMLGSVYAFDGNSTEEGFRIGMVMIWVVFSF